MNNHPSKFSPEKFACFEVAPCKTVNLLTDPCQKSGFYKCLLNSLGDEVLIINAQGRIVFVNDSAVRGLRLPREEILGRIITTFFKTPMSLKKWRSLYFADLKRKRQPVTYRIERVVGKGRTQTIEITASFLAGAGEGHILSIARDISHQLMLQDSLQEAVDLYHSLCEGAGDPILKLDLTGKITYVNHSARHFFRSARVPLLENQLKNVLPTQIFAQVWQSMSQARVDKQQHRFEAEIVSGKGDLRSVELTISPIIESGRVCAFHTMVRDITQRKQLDQLLRDAEGIKAIQYFVQGTARELRHPMMAIVRRIEGLLRKYQGRDFEYVSFKEFREIMDTLEHMAAQVKSCQETTEKIVSLNKERRPVKGEFCDVNAVIREVLRFSHQQMEMLKIRPQTRLAPRLPRVMMGEVEFNHVIGNVVSNAIQAMPTGGTMTIQTGYDAAARQVRVTVRDEGVGIPQEDLKYIFEPFFTTKRAPRKGIGLGLSIVYTLLKASRGEIRINSSVGKGTTVSMYIPAHKV